MIQFLCAELFEYRSNLNKNNENEYMRIAAYIYLCLIKSERQNQCLEKR